MALAQRWTAAISIGLVAGALLACKKKPDRVPAASATPSASAAPSASVSASVEPGPPAVAPIIPVKLGDVKRYGVRKESRLDDAGVRVATDALKVYDEADTTKRDLATLPKGLLVFRLVKMAGFTLIEFQSQSGQFSQGWVETKGLSTAAEKKATRATAIAEKATASLVVTDGGAPTGDAKQPADKK